jgi:hypothetical protein
MRKADEGERATLSVSGLGLLREKENNMACGDFVS